MVPQDRRRGDEGRARLLSRQGALRLLRHRAPGARSERARLVYENADFVVIEPYAPKFPFETWILPRRHARRFEDCAARRVRRPGRCAAGRAAQAARRARRPALQLHPAHRAVRRGATRTLPLAHRDHAEADAGGRLRMGLGLLHQPDAARRGGASSCARSTSLMRILHVASEVAPYSKTGGLADVLGALPRALARARARRHGGDAALSHDRSRALRPGAPAAQPGDAARRRHRRGRRLRGAAAGDAARARLPRRSPAVVRSRRALRRRAAATIPTTRAASRCSAARRWRWRARARRWPDVVHGHDWQAGPALLYAKRAAAICAADDGLHDSQPRLSGAVPRRASSTSWDCPRELLHPSGFEFYGQVSLLKAGLALADRITR